MDVEASRDVLRYLEQVEDFRVNRTKLHSLIDILFVTLCAVICGADGWAEVALFGRSKLEWLRQFVPLANGIPSHDTFGRVFARLDPLQLEQCFLQWMAALAEATEGRLIAIDGKTIRRSFDQATGKKAIHMVSAWATANCISLGQVVVDEKSNEITAIPKLLEIIAISGCLVTIDAMGCQTEIAEKIVAAKADYILAVKGNQPTLHDGIVKFFLDHLEDDFARVKVSRYQTSERGHGREETRTYYVCPVPADLPDRGRWKHLLAIGIAINDTVEDGRSRSEVRYYILSRKLSAKRFGTAVRGHWSIENRLHWQLDVTFGEDQSRIRKGHADANFSILRRTALSLLKNNRTLKVGIKNKRLAAGWDNDYLAQVLLGA